MAKLVLAMFTSLDGYIEGPDGTFVPPPWSDQVARLWAEHNLAEAAHLLYGRVCFTFNAGFWTSDAASGQPETERMNTLPKTVVSRSLPDAPGWNSRVVRSDLAAEVAALKQSVTGGDIYSFGGAGLAQSLMQEDLVDDYYLMLAPFLLGDGKRLFEPGRPRRPLTLIASHTLDVGSVILHYRAGETS